MYHYIIDQSRISPRIFDRLLGEVYGHLTEHQISGEVHRVTRLRNVAELTESAIATGARTLVAIGDDELFLQLVEILANEPSIVLGYIPLVSDSSVARILGLGDLRQSVQAIAQRRSEEFNLGLINRHYFFTDVRFGALNALMMDQGSLTTLNIWTRARFLQASPVTVKVDHNFTVFGSCLIGRVVNAVSGRINSGKLDLLIVPKLSTRELMRYQGELETGDFKKIPGTTALSARYFEIDGPKNLAVSVNGFGSLNRLPLNLSTSVEKIKIIIGKKPVR